MAATLSLPLVAAWVLGACGGDIVTALPAGPDASSILDGASKDVAIEAAADAGCTPYNAGPLDPTSVAAGAMLVGHYGCKQCHSGQMSGNPDGVASPQTEGGLAYPPNLTPDPATGLGCWTNDQVENAFLHGIDNQGQPLCPPMPHFADKGLDASGALDIVEFLRSLPPVKQEVPNTPNCTLGPIDDGGEDDGEAGSSPDAGDGGAQPDAADAGDGATSSDAAGQDGASSDGSSGDGATTTDAGTTDAATTDAAASDAATTDAATGDAGTTDAGTTDAGTTDAGTTDAGTTDAATGDAASTDAAITDAATTDAGDAGHD